MASRVTGRLKLRERRQGPVWYADTRVPGRTPEQTHAPALTGPRRRRDKEKDYEHALDSIRQEIDHNLDVRSACLTALEAVGAEEDR